MRIKSLVIVSAAVAASAGLAQAAGPFSTLDGVSAQPMAAEQMSAVRGEHSPGIARQIFPDGLAGNPQAHPDGTPAGNGHSGVLHAQSMGGTGNHPSTGTDFAGPDHPLK